VSSPQPAPDDDAVIAPPPLPAVAAADAAAERDRRAAEAEAGDASGAPVVAEPKRPRRPARTRPARPRKPKAAVPPRPVPPRPALPPEVAAARFEAAASAPSDVVPPSDGAVESENTAADGITAADEVPTAQPAADQDTVVADVDALEEPATTAVIVDADIDDAEPDTVDIEVPEADAPEADAPEADAPEADAPEADAPEADAPEADAPEIEAAEVEVAEVEADAPVETELGAAAEEVEVEESAGVEEAAQILPEEQSAAASEIDGLATSRDTALVVSGGEDDAGSEGAGDAVRLRGVTKTFGSTVAVDAIDLRIPAGTFYGIVGPNGAGKTTTLSMIAGLLRPDQGEIRIGGIDLARDTRRAKQRMGILPDRLRTFDRLTGRQLLHYYGVLRGLRSSVVESRSAELARAFDLTDALARPVSDYSAGMTKKIMLAGAMIHSPRVLVLDEPFESVDPMSSAVVLDILSAYVAHGGTVVLSSHGMELVERVCTRLAVIVGGRVLAEGTVDEVRGDRTLEQRFIELVGGADEAEGLEWLHTFSD